MMPILVWLLSGDTHGEQAQPNRTGHTITPDHIDSGSVTKEIRCSHSIQLQTAHKSSFDCGSSSPHAQEPVLRLGGHLLMELAWRHDCCP